MLIHRLEKESGLQMGYSTRKKESVDDKRATRRLHCSGNHHYGKMECLE